jgi:acyl-CoA synthetase (AMP-forming)/AMP-acid ligase II
MHEEAFCDPVSSFLTVARTTPDAPVCTWIEDDGRDGDTLTFAALAAGAGSVAARLRGDAGLAAGDRVLVVMQPSLDFVRAFCGCLLARVVPVPAYPPNPFDIAPDLARLRRIADDAGARAVLADGMLLGFRNDGPVPQREWPAVPWYDAGALATAHARPPAWEPPAPTEVAFLQYTSGSTSDPKGVRITHGNLAHQLECNRLELRLGAEARAVLWVPQYHDLGLISGLMSALVGNGRLYQMSPLAFVRRPALWLDVMSRVAATHTAAPNFAYALALRKTRPEERARWRLDALRVVMSAAEPINPRLMDGFFAAFAVAGLRRDAFCGAYGLAEHTVGVSVCGQRALRVDRESLARGEITPSNDDDALMLASCGRPSRGVAVRIVDPADARPLGEGRVGEIWVDSPSKADGYHGQPETSHAVFRARTQDPGDPREYLRSGDLGFLYDGELYVTGRCKDLLIFRGRNLYPSDIEETAERAHAAIRPGCAAAFSVPDAAGEEALVVAAELRGGESATQIEEALAAVAHAVRKRHGQACHAAALLKSGSLPKTTSGKLRRGACRQAFLDGTLTRPPALVRMAAAPSHAPPAPLVPPSVDEIDDSLRRLLARFVNVFSRDKDDRGGYAASVTGRGSLRVLGSTDIPPHRFFSRAATYPALVRHTNTNRHSDDAVVNGRGAALRVLDPAAPDDLGRTLLDVILMTGRRGLVRDAADYVRWFVGDRAAREELARATPSFREYFVDFWRDPRSFVDVHYHSQGAFHYLAAGGGRFLARYRLVEASAARDEGIVDIVGDDWLDGTVARRSDETRPPDFLRREYARRLEAGPIRYRLAVQLVPEPTAEAERDTALDATREWESPWHDVAELTVDALVPLEIAAPLGINIGLAPADLGVVHARSSRDPASVHHLRALVYDLAARLRRREPLPAAIQSLLWEKPAGGRRVCVVGAGPAGLTAALALERRGHEVTVLERAAEPGGMAASVEIDGKPYDLGAHLCTGSYETVSRLAREWNVATEPTTGYFVFDVERRAVVAQDHSLFERETYQRYQSARAQSFADVDRPGLAHSAGALAAPVARWIEENRLGAARGVDGHELRRGRLRLSRRPRAGSALPGQVLGDDWRTLAAATPVHVVDVHNRRRLPDAVAARGVGAARRSLRRPHRRDRAHGREDPRPRRRESLGIRRSRPRRQAGRCAGGPRRR